MLPVRPALRTPQRSAELLLRERWVLLQPAGDVGVNILLDDFIWPATIALKHTQRADDAHVWDAEVKGANEENKDGYATA